MKRVVLSIGGGLTAIGIACGGGEADSELRAEVSELRTALAALSTVESSSTAMPEPSVSQTATPSETPIMAQPTPTTPPPPPPPPATATPVVVVATATPTSIPVDQPLLEPLEVKQIVGGYVLPDGQTARACVQKGATGYSPGLSFELASATHYEGNGAWSVWSGINIQGQGRFLSVRFNERTQQFLLLFAPTACGG
jgi:hypothetical protein